MEIHVSNTENGPAYDLHSAFEVVSDGSTTQGIGFTPGHTTTVLGNALAGIRCN